jgi:hypothetical protein
VAVAPDGQVRLWPALTITRADVVPYSLRRLRRMLGGTRQR